MKICLECKIEKPKGQFSKTQFKKFGGKCKECINTQISSKILPQPNQSFRIAVEEIKQEPPSIPRFETQFPTFIIFSSIHIDDWVSLLEFSKQYRNERNLTATQLMMLLDLPVTMIQYLYNPKIIPSKKINTNGYKLRQKLIDLHDHQLTIEEVPDLSFYDRTFDFEILHKEELSNFGIENFFCFEKNGEKSIKAITTKIIKIEDIRNKLNELGFTEQCAITAEKFEFASHFETPCCMQAHTE